MYYKQSPVDRLVNRNKTCNVTRRPKIRWNQLSTYYYTILYTRGAYHEAFNVIAYYSWKHRWTFFEKPPKSIGTRNNVGLVDIFKKWLMWRLNKWSKTTNTQDYEIWIKKIQMFYWKIRTYDLHYTHYVNYFFRKQNNKCTIILWD